MKINERFTQEYYQTTSPRLLDTCFFLNNPTSDDSTRHDLYLGEYEFFAYNQHSKNEGDEILEELAEGLRLHHNKLMDEIESGNVAITYGVKQELKTGINIVKDKLKNSTRHRQRYKWFLREMNNMRCSSIHAIPVIKTAKLNLDSEYKRLQRKTEKLKTEVHKTTYKNIFDPSPVDLKLLITAWYTDFETLCSFDFDIYLLNEFFGDKRANIFREGKYDNTTKTIEDVLFQLVNTQ